MVYLGWLIPIRKSLDHHDPSPSLNPNMIVGSFLGGQVIFAPRVSGPMSGRTAIGICRNILSDIHNVVFLLAT